MARKYYKLIVFQGGSKDGVFSANSPGGGNGLDKLRASAQLKLYRDGEDPGTVVAETPNGDLMEYPWSKVRTAWRAPTEKAK